MRNAAPEHLVLAVPDVEAEDLPASRRRRCRWPRRRPSTRPGRVPLADVEVGRVEVDVGELEWLQRRVRNAPTVSSRPAQIRDTSDLEIPESTPIASTRSSTVRVETPWT